MEAIDYVPRVEPVVNQWIHHGVGHGQPIECKIDVLDVSVTGDTTIMVDADEV